MFSQSHAQCSEEKGHQAEGEGLAGVGEQKNRLPSDAVRQDAIRIGDREP